MGHVLRAHRALALGAFAVAIAVSGCTRHDDPLTLASDTTRGVYDGDVARTTEHFDAALKLQVTPASVGDLSAKMRALGAYQGLKAASSDDAAHRYTYRAGFSNGAMIVEMRLDAAGKIGAYRVAPGTNGSPPR